jgi:hypothetical protein
MNMPQEHLDEIATRSAAGEGVTHVLLSLGYTDMTECLTYLRDNHNDMIVAAKRDQIARKKE